MRLYSLFQLADMQLPSRLQELLNEQHHKKCGIPKLSLELINHCDFRDFMKSLNEVLNEVDIDDTLKTARRT